MAKRKATEAKQGGTLSDTDRAAAKELAQQAGVLSDPTRLLILRVLGKGPANVTALCTAIGMKQPTASHHLSILRMGRMVEGVRDGKAVTYATLPAVAGLIKALGEFAL